MENFGWNPNPEETAAFVASLPPVYQDQVADLEELDQNQDALNYRAIVACLIDQNSPKVEKIDGVWRLHSENQKQVGSCFPAGTLIRMADGSEKRIEDVRCLDEVLSAEGNARIVLSTMVRQYSGELTSITTVDGNSVQATPEHPIRTPDGYKPIAELKNGDAVAIANSMAIEWSLLSLTGGQSFSGWVYNLHVADDESYVANGIGVHNCVGFGTHTAADTTAACDRIRRNSPSAVPALISPEWCYGASREISNTLGRSDGSYGSAAAKAIRQWGVVHQKKYPTVDLTEYDMARCRNWAAVGVPDELKPIAEPHKMLHTTNVKTAQEAWTLIGNGYGINMCSNMGWDGPRDSEGIIKRNGSWGHSMAISSRRTLKSGQRLLLIHQSWGDKWTSGPYWQDQPLGSFWAFIEDVEQGLKRGDSFAYASFEGFMPVRTGWDDWTPESWSK